MITRRFFGGVLAGAVAAPMIVRATALMPIKVTITGPSLSGFTADEIEEIAAAAIRHYERPSVLHVSRMFYNEYLATLAGLSSDGGILPPPEGCAINRTPSPWWKNSAL